MLALRYSAWQHLTILLSVMFYLLWCWMSLCWASLRWMSLCWVSLRWMSICWVSLKSLAVDEHLDKFCHGIKWEERKTFYNLATRSRTLFSQLNERRGQEEFEKQLKEVLTSLVKLMYRKSEDLFQVRSFHFSAPPSFFLKCLINVKKV